MRSVLLMLAALLLLFGGLWAMLRFWTSGGFSWFWLSVFLLCWMAAVLAYAQVPEHRFGKHTEREDE